MRYTPLFVSDTERHMARAVEHLGNGNEDFAVGSLAKSRKFALRAVNISSGFRAIDMEKFDDGFSKWAHANGVTEACLARLAINVISR